MTRTILGARYGKCIFPPFRETQKKGVLTPALDWSMYSPDLNPIEEFFAELRAFV